MVFYPLKPECGKRVLPKDNRSGGTMVMDGEERTACADRRLERGAIALFTLPKRHSPPLAMGTSDPLRFASLVDFPVKGVQGQLLDRRVATPNGRLKLFDVQLRHRLIDIARKPAFARAEAKGRGAVRALFDAEGQNLGRISKGLPASVPVPKWAR